MSKLEYTDGMALALERLYTSPDVRAQPAAMMQVLQIRPGSKIIDIGSGPGFLSEELAEATGDTGHVLGVDISEDLITRCAARQNPDYLTYAIGDATRLDIEDDRFDVAVCAQVAEYIPDTSAVLFEMFRILKPGRVALVVATAWDTMAWYSHDPERVARIMRAWEGHCARVSLPRVLSPAMRAAGFGQVELRMHPLINTRFAPDSYSCGLAPWILNFAISSSDIAASKAEAWYAELSDLEEAGQYYFASARIIFTAIKPIS